MDTLIAWIMRAIPFGTIAQNGDIKKPAPANTANRCFFQTYFHKLPLADASGISCSEQPSLSPKAGLECLNLPAHADSVTLKS